MKWNGDAAVEQVFTVFEEKRDTGVDRLPTRACFIRLTKPEMKSSLKFLRTFVNVLLERFLGYQ